MGRRGEEIRDTLWLFTMCSLWYFSVSFIFFRICGICTLWGTGSLYAYSLGGNSAEYGMGICTSRFFADYGDFCISASVYACGYCVIFSAYSCIYSRCLPHSVWH